MFKNLINTDFFTNIIKEASDTIIKQDRLKYVKIFNLIRENITNPDVLDTLYGSEIIFSNLDKIITNSTKKSDTSYIEEDVLESNMIIYTTHVKRLTTTITNLIHKHIDKYVQMKSVIPNKEYDIIVNMRNLIKLYRIDIYKNIKLDKLCKTIVDKLSYFLPEIELIDIYNKLYLPNYYDSWNTLIKYEILLYNQIINYKINKPITPAEKVIKPSSTCKIERDIDMYEIKMLIIKYLSNEKYVFVGEWAHNAILNKTDKNNKTNNIQIISENEIENDYNNISKYLHEFTQFGIYYKKKLLYIPKDTRLCKYTFYIKYPTCGKVISDKQFLDIYNCASYELIPFIKIKHDDIFMNIGNIFVQLRFLLIELWLLNLLKKIEIITDNIYYDKYINIFTTIKLIKQKMPDGFINKTNNYIGINIDEKVSKQIFISKNNIKRISYYPELSIRENKKYEIMATSA